MINPEQYPVESHLTPIDGHTFSRDGEWWRGIVRSHDTYGNEHVRLYLWRNNDRKGWVPKHKWNVRAGRWDEEKRVVENYLNKAPGPNSPYFPVQHYSVVGGETIKKTDDWWTAVVQYETDYSSTHKTRLYMWQFDDNDEVKGTGYKWNLSTDTWSSESLVADGFLSNITEN